MQRASTTMQARAPSPLTLTPSTLAAFTPSPLGVGEQKRMTTMELLEKRLGGKIRQPATPIPVGTTTIEAKKERPSTPGLPSGVESASKGITSGTLGTLGTTSVTSVSSV